MVKISLDLSMRLLTFLFLCAVGFSNAQVLENSLRNRDDFQRIIDSHQVKGVIVVLNDKTSTYYSNNFRGGALGHLPASTFKIANSMIGLETGMIPSVDSIFHWDGQKRMFSIWERDMNLREAFQSSCVPCYQEVARKIGAERMQEWLKKLNYAPLKKIDITNIDEFWLRGDFRITPFEQVSFLRRFCSDELEISPETKKNMLQIMRVEGDSTLYAKTGWTQSEGIDQGWYVGFKNTQEGRLIFALFIEQVSAPNFMEARKSIVKECLNLLSEPASQNE